MTKFKKYVDISDIEKEYNISLDEDNKNSFNLYGGYEAATNCMITAWVDDLLDEIYNKGYDLDYNKDIDLQVEHLVNNNEDLKYLQGIVKLFKENDWQDVQILVEY